MARDRGSGSLLIFQRESRARLTRELFLRALRRERGMPDLFFLISVFFQQRSAVYAAAKTFCQGYAQL